MEGWRPAQGFTVLAALPEDRSSVLSIHTGELTTTCNELQLQGI